MVLNMLYHTIMQLWFIPFSIVSISYEIKGLIFVGISDQFISLKSAEHNRPFLMSKEPFKLFTFTETACRQVLTAAFTNTNKDLTFEIKEKLH